MTERWLPVPDYEDLYEVSDQGRVRSLDRLIPHRWPGHQGRVRGRILRATPDRTGHLRVTLSRNAARHYTYVHTLVLLAFVGPRTDGMEACHGNGQPADNRLANLRWDTSQANKLDAVRHGTHWQTRKTRCPQGHVLLQYKFGRVCRECPIERQRAKRRAQTHCANGHELPPFIEGKRRRCGNPLCSPKRSSRAANAA